MNNPTIVLFTYKWKYKRRAEQKGNVETESLVPIGSQKGLSQVKHFSFFAQTMKESPGAHRIAQEVRNPDVGNA